MRQWAQRIIEVVDQHPRTGWYIAVIVTINLLLTILDLRM